MRKKKKTETAKQVMHFTMFMNKANDTNDRLKVCKDSK